MRLLLVGTKETGGGAETHLVELTRALADGGHDVAAVVRKDGIIAKALEQHSSTKLYYAAFPRSTDPAGTMALLRAARDFKPDWMTASFKQEYYSAAIVARATATRLAFFQHTDLPARRLTDMTLPRICDRLIVPSDYLRDHLIARGMPARRISVLHNPVDIERFHPNGELRARMRAQLGFAQDDIVIGYVGRIEHAKGCDVLADALTAAMRDGPRLRGLWVGDGKWAHGLKQFVEEAGHADRHVRTGWVHDTAPYYAAMDLLVLPTTQAETFGRASVEAQASGVPALGSRLGGIPETMIPGTTGVLLPPGDVTAWKDAILDFCANPEKRVTMAARAPEFIAKSFAAREISRRFVTMLSAHDQLS